MQRAEAAPRAVTRAEVSAHLFCPGWQVEGTEDHLFTARRNVIPGLAT